MPNTHRILRVLNAFTPERPEISPEWLMTELGASRASIYRDLQQLSRVGLIERVSERGYSLGPKIVELDRQIRQSDPLLRSAAEIPEQLARTTGGRVLICRLHDDKVLCIQDTSGQHAPSAVSYERGKAMPLYKGATSKIILAHLPTKKVDELFVKEQAAIRSAGLAQTSEELHRLLKQWRNEGSVTTEAELDPQTIGCAVALMQGKRVLGSLSVVLPAQAVSPAKHARDLRELRSAARRIEARLASDHKKPIFTATSPA
ncbi:IclR family transcriptional regulator [Limnohabitans sp.]|jgi:DNA-binding IclR family transcriptional regulator|uniref:IclR family transcriptional regulator n=1 Tax=Limnohabitans sp. TaxID=1907725 RepID=UPI0038BBC46F